MSYNEEKHRNYYFFKFSINKISSKKIMIIVEVITYMNYYIGINIICKS